MNDKQLEFDSEVLEKDEVSYSIPRPYDVVMHNDHYTTMEFVILVLVTIFHHPKSVANRLMRHIHEKGKAVAGTYTKEIAETKASEAMSLARREGFPLRCSVEEK